MYMAFQQKNIVSYSEIVKCLSFIFKKESLVNAYNKIICPYTALYYTNLKDTSFGSTRRLSSELGCSGLSCSGSGNFFINVS